MQKRARDEDNISTPFMPIFLFCLLSPDLRISLFALLNIFRVLAHKNFVFLRNK